MDPTVHIKLNKNSTKYFDSSKLISPEDSRNNITADAMVTSLLFLPIKCYHLSEFSLQCSPNCNAHSAADPPPPPTLLSIPLICLSQTFIHIPSNNFTLYQSFWVSFFSLSTLQELYCSLRAIFQFLTLYF